MYMNIFKRILPFSSMWIRKQVRRHYKGRLRSDSIIGEISTSTAIRIHKGWRVYVRIESENVSLGYINGDLCVFDDGTIKGKLYGESKVCCSVSIIEEADNK